MRFFKKLARLFTGVQKRESPQVRFIETDTDDILRTMPISLKPTQHYIVKKDGEYCIYDSISQMDEETRKTFENLESDAPFTVYVEGEGRTYSSIDEIPEKIRTALKKFDKASKDRT